MNYALYAGRTVEELEANIACDDAHRYAATEADAMEESFMLNEIGIRCRVINLATGERV